MLVTGANGFVGRRLCEALLAREGLVRAAVRRADTGQLPGVEVVPGCNLESDSHWSTALGGVECVVHCAARVHVMKESAVDPLTAFRQLNVGGTLRVATAAVHAGVRRFVFLSSVKVLGESTSDRGPYTEADVPAPEDAYGQSKHEAEQALKALAENTGMEVVIVRSPLVYGPGVGGNFNSLLKLVDSGWPLPFEGIPNARSMVYVGNLIDFLMHLTLRDGVGGETFLVNDGRDISTTELVSMLRRELGRQTRLFGVPWALVSRLARWLRRDALVSRLTGSLQVDASKAWEQAGWHPPYTIEQGIADTLGNRGPMQ